MMFMAVSARLIYILHPPVQLLKCHHLYHEMYSYPHDPV